jgi:hypothetical protein
MHHNSVLKARQLVSAASFHLKCSTIDLWIFPVLWVWLILYHAQWRNIYPEENSERMKVFNEKNFKFLCHIVDRGAVFSVVSTALFDMQQCSRHISAVVNQRANNRGSSVFCRGCPRLYNKDIRQLELELSWVPELAVAAQNWAEYPELAGGK